MAQDELEFIDELDTGLGPREADAFGQAVLHSADWTVETIVAQLRRGNIEMNPRFQRRDAWNTRRKSNFIESLILGLPVPQIVLAEKQGQRGRYIVLDGKQRLLSLLQFTGHAEEPNNRFRLSGLEARTDLVRKSFDDIESDPALEDDLNALLNYTIRTVVIRNWPSTDFLHLVFLRLNTGSVKLSPQELRQAMFPGAFSDYIDDSAARSRSLQTLLSRDSPDPRMRDVELLVRFLAFRFFLPDYAGRMKAFLDFACDSFNRDWPQWEPRVAEAIRDFELGTQSLFQIFGPDSLARKSKSRSFNRAIFDALIFYASNEPIREQMELRENDVRDAYDDAIADPEFLETVESDTAGIPHTLGRLRGWGLALEHALGIQLTLPIGRVNHPDGPAQIMFDGF